MLLKNEGGIFYGMVEKTGRATAENLHRIAAEVRHFLCLFVCLFVVVFFFFLTLKLLVGFSGLTHRERVISRAD
ncbi:hypothetical protein WDU94_002612 [Cyamophila willieti]